MLLDAGALALLAILLAWPAPILLARARWTARAPGTALVLWQAIALAGGLSMIGAPLCLGLAPFGDWLPAAVVGAARSGFADGAVALPALSLAALLAAALIAGYLLAHLATTIARVSAQRRRHHELLDLLSSPHPTRERTRVLDDAHLLAYCLPRGFGSLTVLSQGLLDSLSRDELTAVVAHEEAHLQQRHDIVLIAFRAWHAALPGFPIAALAESRVTALVEMLADDRARVATDDATVARAALTVAERAHITGSSDARVPAERSDRATDDEDERAVVLRARLTRLVSSLPPLPTGARVAVVVAAIALVAVPTIGLTTPLFAG